ncbi:hypothetical protein GCM10020220_048020 [Nonomuraea rubra]
MRGLRGHPLWRKIVEADPELLVPYLLDRRGASHEAILAVLEPAVGDPARARAVLLVAQSFLLSAPTMLDPRHAGRARRRARRPAGGLPWIAR